MDIQLFLPLLLVLAFVPIILTGRRQRRQMQERQNLQNALEVGDVVMTTSGLRGTVVDASYEETIDIEIADGVVTTWNRAAVLDRVLPPAEETADADEPVAVDAEPVVDVEPDTTRVDAKVDAKIDAKVDVDKTGSPSLQKDDSANGSTRG